MDKTRQFEAITQTVRKHIPKKLRRSPHGYRFIFPWLFIREDLLTHALTDRWYLEKLGISRWRLLRDLYLRKKFHTPLECDAEVIFYKKSSVRFFLKEQGVVHKVFFTNEIRALETFENELRWRELFAPYVPTVKVLEKESASLVERISPGERVQEHQFVNTPRLIDHAFETLLQILRVHPYRRGDDDGILYGTLHGDFQVHNLLWDPQRKQFVVLDWERAGHYPVLWDLFLFFYKLFDKNKIYRSSRLRRKTEALTAEYLQRFADELELDNDEMHRQLNACEKIYLSLYGEKTSSKNPITHAMRMHMMQKAMR